MSKVIVGIDYSLSSPAICLIRGERVKLFAFSNTKKFDPLYTKDNFSIHLYEYPVYSCEQERHDKISGWAIGCIKNNLGDDIPDKIVLEGYSFGSSAGRCFDIAENCGLLKHKIWKEGWNLVTVPPTTLKKAVTGKGNAKKEDMIQKFTEEYFDLSLLMGMKKASQKPIDDLCDAFYLACKNF